MTVEAAPVERSAIPQAVREVAGDLLPDAPGGEDGNESAGPL